MIHSGINTLAEVALKHTEEIPYATLSSSPLLLRASVSNLSLSDPYLMSAMSARRPSLLPTSTMTSSFSQALPTAADDHNAIYLAILDEQKRRSMNFLKSARADIPTINMMTAAHNPVVVHSTGRGGASYAASTTQTKFDSAVSVPRRSCKPNFAEKLHAVISSKDCSHAISWLPSGQSFRITDQGEFVTKILPKYFREAKFDSFSRRLKRWSFRKMYTTGLRQIIFSHDSFHRDRPDLCKTMNGRDKAAAPVATAAVEVTPEVPPGSAVSSQYAPRDYSRKSLIFQRAQLQQQQAQEAMLREQMAIRQEWDQRRVAAIRAASSHAMSPLQVTSNPTEADSSPVSLRGMSTSPEGAVSKEADHSSPAVMSDGSKMQLTSLNKDIAECEERLEMLQRLRGLKGRPAVN